MGKRTTKAELILREAKSLLDAARLDADDAGRMVASAQAILDTKLAVAGALLGSYNALERSLARATRRPKSQPAPAAATRLPRKSKTDTPPVITEVETESATPVAGCVVPNCGQPESALIHERGEGSHKFHATIKTKGAGA